MGPSLWNICTVFPNKQCVPTYNFSDLYEMRLFTFIEYTLKANVPWLVFTYCCIC